MNRQQAEQLAPGIYILEWKIGGASVAAVGVLHDGRRWYAPINWTSVSPMGIASCNWVQVRRARPVESVSMAIHEAEHRR